MPNYSGMWNLVQQLQGVAAGGWPTQEYNWIGLFNNRSAANAIVTDSDRNMYIAGSSSSTSPTSLSVAKYDKYAQLQWQRQLIGTYGVYPSSMTIDASSNIYIVGAYNVTQFNTGIFLAKYNSSGTLQWQKIIQNLEDSASGIVLDSSGNIYISGTYITGGTNNIGIFKLDATGAITWQRYFGDAASSFYGRGIGIDSSGNVYVGGHTNASPAGFQILKYNASGTLQWQRKLSGGSNINAYDLKSDSSGNVYICGQTASANPSAPAGVRTAQIAKYNSSGTIQWQRNVYGTTDCYFSDMYVDASNVYLVGVSEQSGTPDIIMFKYDVSGTLQWQRRLRSSANDVSASITVDNAGNVCCANYATVSSLIQTLISKVPGDGSSTGTYNVGGVNFTYEASSLTSSTFGMTDASTSLTSSTAAATVTTATLTGSTTSYTTSVTTI